MHFIVTIGDQEIQLKAILGNPSVLVHWHNRELLARLEGKPGSKIYALHIDDQTFRVGIFKQNDAYCIQLHGQDFPITIERPTVRRSQVLLRRVMPRQHGPTLQTVLSHMPGLIARISVKEGQAINTGDSMGVLEAMKMENDFKAPVSGIVEKVHVQPGSQVEKGQLLCTIRTSEHR